MGAKEVTVEHWFALFVLADVSLYAMASMVVRAIDRNTEALSKLERRSTCSAP
jgi:hypothetical protein